MPTARIETEAPAACGNADAVIDLWETRNYDTHDIAWVMNMREAEVARIIHAHREARVRAASAAIPAAFPPATATSATEGC